jgi:hypothetical protein
LESHGTLLPATPSIWFNIGVDAGPVAPKQSIQLDKLANLEFVKSRLTAQRVNPAADAPAGIEPL